MLTITISSPVESWALWAELLFLVFLEFLLCGWAVLWVWALWRYSLNEAKLDRYRQWCCPDCQRPFGKDLQWVIYLERSPVDARGERLSLPVSIHCPRLPLPE